MAKTKARKIKTKIKTKKQTVSKGPLKGENKMNEENNNNENEAIEKPKNKKLLKRSVQLGIAKEAGYKTTDGEIFKNQNDALAHQEKIAFIEWYKENGFNDEYDEISANQMEAWLKEHKEDLFTLLGK